MITCTCGLTFTNASDALFHTCAPFQPNSGDPLFDTEYECFANEPQVRHRALNEAGMLRRQAYRVLQSNRFDFMDIYRANIADARDEIERATRYRCQY